MEKNLFSEVLMAQNNAASPAGGILICCKGAGQILVQGENCPDLTLWCDMDPKSSLFFSSIGENSAMLCLNRSVELKNGTLEPQERRVAYDPRKSVGENLLHCAAEWIGTAAGERTKES